MSKSDASQTTRRDFLKVAATSVPAAAAAVAVSGDAAEAAPVDPTSERMQDTAHVRTYYDLARF
ncbi:MAG: ubiquinol-cytochrome c reductase iron-sulfur subunit N-terminal domain-containing protein [Pseudomonadota bacterium]|jgi:hypothetical protein|uniref:ubiquinol-cytochrome c reductase iron-sulfur subunit N-terminal domain-containing protein n=1 Tax=Thalassovita sp. TaxID=1979401 RepID=UPI002AB26945|nr:ubiquinol-cytochrome c reductase iron-sulfur subunit N-terminal domain-containing protein [Thalassovita sp.]MEC7964593.1 ubiquinol-cytochrome c reductase iron-sulfur subunit N-terminal domain-containing protein [Pseudomonadota bacterium]MEC8039847.1 ubiquinol-cytochrome c reductase iron-sulfur subunit N-terminal domain-containing protein [Pseudomonadota bacterium]MEC8295915.1 ubiquinol-cytochrome c reductase iron-sulfur subunit N-terminal domain-containing protein [Pseudomonadota bacterium]|tara:strand:- start:166 stop:357 length:192 start_codon:yes stop_codon:yes gene_type:complete